MPQLNSQRTTIGAEYLSGHLRARQGRRAQLWFALRVGTWLCCLPLVLRVYALPTLLHRLTPTRAPRQRKRQLELDRAVQVVVRVCQLRFFRLPLFPRACLRQALTLYSVLTRLGYPVQIHFGVQKKAEDLRGHSWVTLQGRPVAEHTHPEGFTIVYSYPDSLNP